MKAREWWLFRSTRMGKFVEMVAKTEPTNHKCLIHVKEVLPDAATFTRGEFRAAVERATNRSVDKLNFEPMDAAVERELFGPTSSTDTTGETK